MACGNMSAGKSRAESLKKNPAKASSRNCWQMQGRQEPVGFKTISPSLLSAVIRSLTMLDAHYIRENLDAVKANCRNRNVKVDPDRVMQLDDQRKQLIQETQTLQQRANEVAKITGKEKDAAKKQALIAEGRGLRAKVWELEAKGKQ